MIALTERLTRVWRQGALVAVGFFLTLTNVCAQVPSQQARDLADDPLTERRLQAISADLRCLVCQNESLAASNADLAVDLRREIRSMIQANQSDQQIMDFLVTRYGDFVLYKPPFKPLTWVLWIGPGVLGLLGLFVLFRHTRQTRAMAGAPESTSSTLSDQDIEQANRLLGVADNETPPTGRS
jgi:cytochrome c-type biogenesis protein CcmH